MFQSISKVNSYVFLYAYMYFNSYHAKYAYNTLIEGDG